MAHLKPMLEIVLSAITAVFIALIGLIVLTTVAFHRHGGPFILLYYWAYVVLYIFPIALVMGALFGLFTLFNENPSDAKRKRKPMSHVTAIGVVLIFMTICGLITVAYMGIT